MTLRVHLPRDPGLGALTHGGTHSLADLLRMELVFRRMSHRELAECLGKGHSTLGYYLRGEREFPPEVLESIIDVLHDLGPFGVPGLAELRVIPTLEELPEFPEWRSTDPQHAGGYSDMWIDTVWVNIDVPVDWQPHVLAYLEREHERAGKKHPAVRGNDHHAFRLSPWDTDEGDKRHAQPIVSTRRVKSRQRDWLRVQVKLTDPAQYAAHGHLVDRLAARLPPDGVRLKRIDFCKDYPVDPTWLVARRFRARHYEWMTSFQGAHTIAVGKKGSSRYFLRCYDAAALHGLPAPHTRIEMEWRPKRGLSWADLAGGFDNPFNKVWVGTLTAPGLTPREIVLLQLARSSGLTAFSKTLDRDERRVLDRAIKKLESAPAIRPDLDFDRANWTYLRPVLKGVFGR